MRLVEELQQLQVPEGKIAVCWVNQAGFLLKGSSGKLVAVDLYLSECGERMKNFKRIAAKLIEPEELNPAYYLITHSHFDHLDYDAVPVIGASGGTTFVTTPSCSGILKEMHIPEKLICRLNYDESIMLGDIRITAVEADHSNMVPDSFGYIVEMSGHVLYFTGDTCYRPDIFRRVAARRPDIIVTCINGHFGNMDAAEGARAAYEVGARIAIPCHFWTFMQHGGDPLCFCEEIEKQHTCCRALCFRQGEIKLL